MFNTQDSGRLASSPAGPLPTAFKAAKFPLSAGSANRTQTTDKKRILSAEREFFAAQKMFFPAVREMLVVEMPQARYGCGG